MAETVIDGQAMSNLYPWSGNKEGLDRWAYRAEQKSLNFQCQAPATATTQKYFMGKFDHPITLSRVTVALDVDGAGSGNTVTIDVLQGTTSCIGTTKPDFATSGTVATPEDADLEQADSDVTIPADTNIFLSLTSSGTITAGHKVSGQVLFKADNVNS